MTGVTSTNTRSDLSVPDSKPGQTGAQSASVDSSTPVVGANPSVGVLAVSLLNAIGEGVALCTRQGDVLWSNDLFQRLSSAMQERIAVACRQFDQKHPVVPEGVEDHAAIIDPRMDHVMTDDQRYYEVGVLGAPAIRSADPGRPGITHGLVAVIRDVTPARRLQFRVNAIDQAGSELLRFDADVVRRYNAHERLKLLEEKIARFSRDLLRFDHLAIRLLDERSGKLELVIGYNLPPDFDSFELRPQLQGSGISGYVAASGRSYVCEDTGKDDLYLPGILNAKSSLTVPLRVQDKVIGIMNVESLQQAAFDDEDRQLGEMFARYIALAIHMLDLLVVERSTTNQTISGRVEIELNEPLLDIAHEVDLLQAHGPHDPETAAHLSRIERDIEAIRSRLRECAAGPTSLLGVEQALNVKSADPLLQGRRVLIADDEPKIRTIVGSVLKNRGCVVTVCENGAIAIDRMNQAGAGAFDLVLSDIRMPDKNGYEVFAASKKLNPDAPVILITGFGYDPHHSIVRASQEGLQAVLFKPFQVERLIEEVRKAFASRVAK
ncbi:MAG: response regulator [Phycisphaerales bacterium]